jgi:hypothetical protein
MRRAGHTVNAAIDTTDAVLPEVPGVDLAATVARVVGWGGDAALYTYFLAGATVENARSLATVAGWRAGVIGLRSAALDALAELGEAAYPALGLPETFAAAFVRNQAADPFAWPAAEGEVATVGGFAGLGGPWLAPPTNPIVTGVGMFRVTSGSQDWQIEADVFGARVSRGGVGGPPARVVAHPAVVASVSADSYLVTLVRT